MPVALLAYVQVVFLPYHDPAITWVHRLALLSDIAFLTLVGVFLLHIETSFLRALLHTSIYHPLSFLLTAGLLATVAAGSLFVATVPGEAVDRYAPLLGRQDGNGQGAMFGAVLPWAEPVLGLFRRSLHVVDTDLASTGRDARRASISLRGRDLRYARPDRTDLHRPT
jgi:hypothetical protein